MRDGRNPTEHTQPWALAPTIRPATALPNDARRFGDGADDRGKQVRAKDGGRQAAHATEPNSALGRDIVRSVARLRDIVVDCEPLGVTDTDDDPTVLVEPISGDGVRLFFQKVPEPKQVKNRLHLDLQSDASENEVDRLRVRGARELFRMETQAILTDPEGNEFCVDVPR
jgi:hypothetical protein